MECSMPCLPVHHQCLELAQTHVHWIGDAIQPSHLCFPLSLPFLTFCHKGGVICISEEYIVQNAGLDESQAGIKIAERNINNFRYADDNIHMAESEKGEFAALKHNIQKSKIMASSPITSWQIDGETMETETLF